MIKKVSGNKSAIIILHEIYGVNKFIEKICIEYHKLLYDVYCPDMLCGIKFQYSDSAMAYDYFFGNIGFDFYRKVESLIDEISNKYDNIFIIGFSIGATIAWRCCENNKCSGIICCYGSRIRDYLLLEPSCPTLLLFAEQDFFDVEYVVENLQAKNNTEIYTFPSEHGFMDFYSQSFNEIQAKKAMASIKDFLLRFS